MLQKIGIYSAIISFVLGTLLFLGFFYLDNGYQLMEPGFIFVIVAGIVNSMIVLLLLIDSIKSKENRKKIVITIFLILLNIPISVYYFNLVMEEYFKGMERF